MWKNWRGQALKRRTAHEMGKALVRAGEATQGEVLKQIPHDEGILQETVIVLQNPMDPLDVILSAGGGPGTGFPLVPYAYKWHELKEKTTGRTFSNVNFQKGRKSQYVRDPIKTFAPNAVTKELKKAGRKAW